MCRDGIFEAVYNHNGKACEKDIDDTNMGTYNYASPSNKNNHTKYDVLPYFDNGNTGKDKVNVPLSIENGARFFAVDSVNHLGSETKRAREGREARQYRNNFLSEWIKAGGTI